MHAPSTTCDIDRAASPTTTVAAAVVHPWRALIVDDDADVHRATELALTGVQIEGRPLAFVHAYSAAQARQLLATDASICVMLLDVVMETPHAGLELVRALRQEPGRPELRIILRTGQPGYAPELETVRDYDIDDYCTKAELTSIRLYTSLTTAIRCHRMILSLRESHETMEQCVAQRTRELSDAVVALEAFNRMVSHDLRGPLSGIAGMSGLIQDDLARGDTARVQRWMAMMQSQVNRLVRLVDDLLNLTRVGQGELLRTPQPMDSVLAEALEVLALSQPPERIGAISAGPLPQARIDPGLMRQVFVNLLGNALKFTQDTVAPQVAVQAERGDAEWTIRVLDNGPGFDSQRAARLFTPFGQLHGPQYQGSGIGLTIVRRIVERHGGRVWAENRPEGGAAFCFTLPLD
jgi:signal transduction histidine kinase